MARAEDRLPVEAFARLPDVSQVKLSPDGKNVAFLVKVNTGEILGTAVQVLNLDTAKLSTLAYGQVSNYITNWIRWANDDYLLLSARFPAKRNRTPTTETRLFSLNISTSKLQDVLSDQFLRRQDRVPQYQDRIVDILRDDKENILLAGNFESVHESQIFRINIVTRKTKRLIRGMNNVVDWVTDRQNRVRVAVRRNETDYQVMHRAPDAKKWNVLWEFQAFAEDQVWPKSFDKDPDILYINAYHEGRLAVFKVRLSDPELRRELVFSDPVYDAGGSLIYSRISDDVIGIRFSTEGGYTFWDDDYMELQDAIDKALPETANIVYSLSNDERKYVVVATSDVEAGTYYVGDRDKHQIRRLAERYQALSDASLAETTDISYEARDGMKIAGYLTRPADAHSRPYPAIIFPHGGPISFDDGGFDYWTQYFASRGYAVLQMNFRGSGGYGYDFMKAGLQKWGLEMQNDVEDGTRWMIEQGIADPEHICVIGASYGGYAALMEAARNPELYKCAVSFAGVTDVAYLVNSMRNYSNYEIVKEQIGSDRGILRQRSPLHIVEDIQIPVLLGHGTDDRSVRVQHSRKMHRALEKNNKDVTYLELKDGNHYLSNEDHRIQFFKAMDAFLQSHL